MMQLPLTLDSSPETAAPEARRDDYSSIPRYRLSLVRESEAIYSATELNHPELVAEFLWREIYQDAPQEMMAAVFLDTLNRVIGYQVAYIGSLNRIKAEPRAILAAALLCNANAFLIAHNHPSGDPSPSQNDLDFTRALVEAGKALNIRLTDHLILGDRGRWVSLRLRGEPFN